MAFYQCKRIGGNLRAWFFRRYTSAAQRHPGLGRDRVPIDWLTGTPKEFTAIGMVLGAGLSIYLVYLRYGRGDGESR